MKSIPMTDGSGWFDEDKAIVFNEDTWHDGRNHISTATGSQWDHEALYYTKSGNWVLNCWSNYQGTAESYGPVSAEDAAAWLIQNSRLDGKQFAKLPESVRLAVNETVDAVEV